MASLLFHNFAVFQTIFHSLVVAEDHMKRSLKILPGRWLETVRRHQCGEDLRPAGDTEAFALGPFTLCVIFKSHLYWNLNTLYSTLCPCQCAVCMSMSSPIPIRYQYTLSPTSMFRPSRFAYMSPLIPARHRKHFKAHVQVSSRILYIITSHFACPLCVSSSPCILLLSMKVSSSFRFAFGFLMWVRMLSSRYLELKYLISQYAFTWR